LTCRSLETGDSLKVAETAISSVLKS